MSATPLITNQLVGDVVDDGDDGDVPSEHCLLIKI